MKLAKMSANSLKGEKDRTAKERAQALKILNRLELKIRSHIHLYENIFSPFLKKHVPRLEPLLILFRFEHHELLLSLKHAMKGLRESDKGSEAGESDEDGHDYGLFLLCLIRHHFYAEEQKLAGAIQSDLNQKEKRSLRQLIRKDAGAESVHSEYEEYKKAEAPPLHIVNFLKSQHLVILDELAYLDKLRKLRKPDKEHEMRGVIQCISAAVEKHAEIEDKFLFPAMKNFLGEKGRPAYIWELEHGKIRRILHALNEMDDPSKVRVEAGKFIAYLRDHILMEEVTLFPFTAEVLSEKRLQIIGRIVKEFLVGRISRHLGIRSGSQKNEAPKPPSQPKAGRGKRESGKNMDKKV